MLLILSGLSAVPGVLLFIAAWFKRFGTEIAVTDRRVIYKTGLVQRYTTEINMAKIESVDVSQSILGRVFGFGTLTIRGTGETIEALRNIASPLQFPKRYNGAVSRCRLIRRRGMIPPPPGPSFSAGLSRF